MKKNIYLLEDDEDISTLVAYLVGEIGFEVSTHSSIAGLWLSLKKASPDLFILDIMLPDGSGLEVCRTLKSNSATSQIPVIMMSAHANGAALVKDAAADDFIAKPFEIENFIAKVQSRLSD